MPACLTPLHITDKETGIVRVVPCGRCDACLVRARAEWVYRLQEELRVAQSAFFITLTYDTENLPISEFVENETGAIFYDAVNDVRDLQLFNKKFRYRLKRENDIKARYYIISEYGPCTQRPHYHGIYFFDKYIDLDTVDRLVRECWPSPIVTVDYVTDYRIKYVTEYCVTKSDIPDHLPPNIRIVSRNPGLGYAYVDKLKDWHLQDPENRMYAPTYNGDRCNLPRYYRTKIFSKEFLDRRARELEEQKFNEEYERENAPDFDPDKYWATKKQEFKDYHNHITRFLKKNKKL